MGHCYQGLPAKAKLKNKLNYILTPSPRKRVMSITIQLDLPEELATKAQAAGLLEPARVTNLIERELQSVEDKRSFFEILREIRAQSGEPMSEEEIVAEVKSARRERLAREARH
jgi:hypothetical protein